MGEQQDEIHKNITAKFLKRAKKHKIYRLTLGIPLCQAPSDRCNRAKATNRHSDLQMLGVFLLTNGDSSKYKYSQIFASVSERTIEVTITLTTHRQSISLKSNPFPNPDPQVNT